MDYDACIADIAGHVETAGKKNGQRWIVDRGALRTILEHYAKPEPKPAPKPKKAKAKDEEAAPDDS